MAHERRPDPERESALIVCDLAALTASQRHERERLAAALQVGVIDIIELPDGYAFRLDRHSAIAHQVEEFVALERACCPFLRFRTLSDTASDQVTLEVTGRDDVKEFLASQFGIRNVL